MRAQGLPRRAREARSGRLRAQGVATHRGRPNANTPDDPARAADPIMQILLPRASRTRARATTLAALIPLFLAACGGGGGSTPPPPPPPPSNSALVYGTAAAGSAVSGTVTIEDAAGRTAVLPVTAGSGAFSASVDGMTAPFMLKVVSSDGTTVLYSAIPQPGRANITPLTSLALMRIAASRGLHGPADLYAQPGDFATWDTASGLAASSSVMLSRLMPAFTAQLPGAPSTPQTAPTYDPFGTAWTVGSGVDHLLDAYPVTFTTDGTGIVTALQTDHASGLAVDVARSDTAALVATSLAIAGAGQGTLVGGSAAQFGAQAQFAGGAQQAVSATWSISGLAGATIDSNGRLSVPAVDTAATVTVTARWFDGTQASAASLDMTVLPGMRPVSLEITGAAPNASVAAGASVALGATVHWSDGSTTTPAATWSFAGDATAVTQLGSDGLLRAGKPTSDSPIVVTAAFSQAGVPVSAQLPLTVAHFVRRVQSVSLTGLVSGQVLTAGDHADLTLTALWNDGTESTLAPFWASVPAAGATHNIATSISTAGKLTVASYYVPTTADADARAAESDVLLATYDNGDGSIGQLSVPFSVAPLVNIPTALEIRGVTAMNERDSASFPVWVDFADGSSAPADGTITSQDGTMLSPAGPPNAYNVFFAGNYASKPAAPIVATLVASRTYAYQDASGQPVSVTLSATHAVEVDWVEPVLTAMSVAVDHLPAGTATTVAVTGTFTKFGATTTAPVTDATLAVDSALVTVNGNTLTPQTPATPDASWVTLSVSAAGGISTRRLVTVDLPGSVPKRLLSYPWSPLDPDVQFRAISSDGHVDDYTVTRTLPDLLGYESAATARRLPLLSGVTDLTQSQMDSHLPMGAPQETQYVAAVEGGRAVVIRHDDLYDANRLVTPVVVPDIANARQVALVARRDDGNPPPAAIRLYVLDQAGIVRQYKLPYIATRALVAADVQFERQLTGTFSQMSAGADFIQLLSTSGGAYAEGSDQLGALGDPAGASHWNDTFAVQFGVDCPSTCQYAPLTGVLQVHAGLDQSFVALTDELTYWPGPGLTLEFYGPTRVVGPDIGITAIAVHAWMQSDRSIHFLNLAFAEDADGGPGQIAFGSTPIDVIATWLPPASGIVDGRRPVAATVWPNPGGEYAMDPSMPIVRTTQDTLYYLDGRAIRDPQGNAIVLP